MKRESVLSPVNNEDDINVVLAAAVMTEDIVEDFARQLDEVVRIQDAMEEEVVEEFQEQQQIDDSDEDDCMFGYQQLPQDDNEDIDVNMYGQLASDDDEEEQDNENNQADIKAPLQIELAKSDQLEPETSDLIKSIMSNVKLSDEAIPEWAKKIPEEAWLPRTAIEKK